MNDPIFHNPDADPSAVQLYDFYGTPAELVVGSTEDAMIPLPASPRPVILAHCGSPSGLCALAILEQPEIDAFIAANPVATKTFITLGLNGGLVFWFQCKNNHLLNAITSTVSFCADGLVPYAWKNEDLDNRVYCTQQVAEIKLDTLKWDHPDIKHAFRIGRMAAVYGPLFRRLGPRKSVLNEAIICRMFSADAGVLYDAQARQFFKKVTSGELEYLSQEALLASFAGWLERFAVNQGTNFPFRELRLTRLKSLAEYVKMVAVIPQPNPHQSLTEFVKTSLCIQPGADVTTQEIYANYVPYAEQHKIGRYLRCKFERQLPKVIGDIFGVMRRNDIRRPKENRLTSRRGFRGLAFRPDGTDCNDASDDSISKMPPLSQSPIWNQKL